MSDKTVAVAAHTHTRLQALARHEGKTSTSKLTELVDAACLAAGLDVASDAVHVQPFRGDYVVDLFGGAFRVELPRIGVLSLAKSLTDVADHAGLSMNLDLHYTVRRQGSGVILEIDAIAKKPGQLGGETIKLKKSMAPKVAREIARGLLAGLPVEAAA